jgi:hypothetical protein
MSRRGRLLGVSAPLVALVALVAVVGCGGSAVQSTTTVTVGGQAATISTTSTTHGSRPRHHGGAPSGSATTRTTTHGSSAPAARVPATYAIAASGTLSPPTVSAPAGYDVQLTFVNRGRKADAVTIHLKTPLTLAAPGGQKTFAFLPKPAKGTYRIDVNGQSAGALVIGAAPGP